MQFNITFEPEFDQLYESFLTDPVKKQYLELDGISPDKLDVGAMSYRYFTLRLADSSVDMNANANEELSANNYQAEVVKGLLKLEGYYLIWKYMKKRFGLERANEAISAIWEGKLYFHDASGHGVQVPYCFAYSTTNIMLEGRPYGQLHSLPPKRSDSFMAQVTEVTMDLSQEFMGAVAPSDMLVNLAYYLKREGVNPDTEEGADYITNLWQKFIHVMNNKFRVSGQSLKYETPILINNQWVKIGDFVESHGGNNLIEDGYTTLSFNIKTGVVSRNKIYGVTKHKRENPLVEVETVTGQKIIVTANHSLFSLTEDGSIDITAPSDNPKNVIIPINFATDENQVVDVSSYKQDSYRKIYDYINLDNKIMYLIGYYIGNGSCDGSTLRLSVFNEELEEYFITNYPEFKPNRSNGTIKLNVGRQFCDWLKDTFGHGSHNKHIPPAFSLKVNSLHLVAGYLDADGYTDGKNITASSVSEQLLRDIQYTLQAHGLISTFFKTQKNDNNYTGKSYLMNCLYISNDYAYQIPCRIKGVQYFSLNTEPSYDLTGIKKACQKIFKQSKYNWGTKAIRYSVLNKLENDLKEIISFDIENCSDYKEMAKLFGLPIAIANKTTAMKLYGLAKGYNLSTNVNINYFLEVAKARVVEVQKLLTKVQALKHIMPIKIKSIKQLQDNDEYVYDISVENDENFVAGNAIMAHNSPFTNVSIFDRPNLEKLFGDVCYPDGSKIDVEYVMKVQKIAARFFAKGDPATSLPYRFPVK